MKSSLSAGPGVSIPDRADAHHVVLDWAERTPEAPAIKAGGRTVSYRELVRRARVLHSRLDAHGVRPGTLVPVVAKAGEPFAVAALAVLLAGGAYAALDPRWPAARLAGVLDDLGSPLVVDAVGEAELPAGLVRLTMPGPTETAPELPAAKPGADAPACVFFTSGSTGRPKGVVLPHRALIRTFIDGGDTGFSSDTVMPLGAAPYWDAGALETFGPLMNGGCGVEVPESMVTPDALRRLIRSDGANTLFLTCSLLNLVVDEDLDAFAGLRHVMTGGERVSSNHLGRLLSAHPGIRLSNLYGPVESMVFVSTHDVTEADLTRSDGVPVGTAARNTVLAVVDEADQPVPHGSEGELCVGGDGLALGYLNRPDEDARRFTTLDLPDHGSLRVYRTGDRVRMDEVGLLSYVGRADRQFKIRGYRVEPGEIERVVAGIDGIREAFLVPVRDGAGTVTGTVCAYSTESMLVPEEVHDRSRHLLPGYLLPDRFVQLAEVPIGATGKTDLRAVEALVLAATVHVGGQQDDPAASVALREVRDVLGLPTLSADGDLLAAGATSLHMLRIAARLSRLLNVELSVQDIYRHSAVAELERLAGERPPRDAKATATAESAELSPGERRFWLAERLAPGAPGHVAVSRIEVTGPLDPPRMEKALAAVVAAHPALRTAFPLEKGRPRRVVSPEPHLTPLRYQRVESDAEAACRHMVEELAASVHDLAQGPLLAAGIVFSDTAEQHTLLIAVHHCIYDARSEETLVADLATAYVGDSLPVDAPPPPGTASQTGEEQRDFWRSELAGLEPLALPNGRSWTIRQLWASPPVVHRIGLPSGTAELLRRVAVRERCPAVTPLLAAWWRALAGWTGQCDLAVGTIIADRQAAHERTVGYFANGVPVRLFGAPEALGQKLIPFVRERLLEVFAHASLPTDEIAGLATRTPDGRMPLYQNLLVLQRVAEPVRAADLLLTPRPMSPLGPQAEICCELWEEGDQLSGTLHAPAGLLDASELADLSHLFESELALLLGKELT